MFEALFVIQLCFFPNAKYIFLLIRDGSCEYLLHIWNYDVVY